MNDHESGFLQFLVEPNRRRLKELLEMGEKRRNYLRSRLHHSVRLDPRYSQQLNGQDVSANALAPLLRKYGAPSDCYIFGSHEELDGRTMPLHDALDEVISIGAGTFISCVPGRLGFFQYEALNPTAYLLIK